MTDRMGGVMGAGMRMMSAGLSMGQVQGVAREVLAYAREKAGADDDWRDRRGDPGLGAICLSSTCLTRRNCAEGEH